MLQSAILNFYIELNLHLVPSPFSSITFSGAGGWERESWIDRNKVRKQETSPPRRLVRVCKERVAGGIVVARGTFLGSYEVNSGAGGGGLAYF